MEVRRSYFETRKGREEALRILRAGGVVIIPTDTLYGLSTPISSQEGYRRILELKRCEEGRSFLLLAGSIGMVERYIESWGSTSRDEMEKIWPAPLTAVLPAGGRCPEWVGGSIAFRVPDFDALLEVVSGLGEPIVSTSANLRGDSPLHRIEEIERLFKGSVDLILAGRRASQDLPSTIVDFTRPEPFLVRRGSYPW